MIYGYARGSTRKQVETVPAQVEALTAAGAQKIWRETASGASASRSEWRKAIAALEPGDVLIVTRLDRFARSLHHALDVLAQITGKGAALRSLREAWADTRDQTPTGRLMRNVMLGFAEFERELIIERTTEGRARAKARGTKLGRDHKMTPHQRQEAKARLDAGDESPADIARSYNVSRSTISRLRGNADA